MYVHICIYKKKKKKKQVKSSVSINEKCIREIFFFCFAIAQMRICRDCMCVYTPLNSLEASITLPEHFDTCQANWESNSKVKKQKLNQDEEKQKRENEEIRQYETSARTDAGLSIYIYTALPRRRVCLKTLALISSPTIQLWYLFPFAHTFPIHTHRSNGLQTESHVNPYTFFSSPYIYSSFLLFFYLFSYFLFFCIIVAENKSRVR